MFRWFFTSALHGGFSLVGLVGVGLMLLAQWTGAPTAGFGAGMFGFAVVLFVLTGGCRGW